jgi:hypothetical protein
MHGALRAMLRFAGTTVDGEASAVYPPAYGERRALLRPHRPLDGKQSTY